ncbi:MAG: hypothetical protein WCG27_07630, partial [Pseudomonadota bacterium]
MKMVTFIVFYLLVSNTYAVQRSVVTSLYPLGLSALNLIDGISSIRVTTFGEISGACPHDRALSAADWAGLSWAQVFLADGLGIETYGDLIQKRYPKLPLVNT